ncbi:MAG: AI-2E family transporter [Anaerolineae bacterium]
MASAPPEQGTVGRPVTRGWLASLRGPLGADEPGSWWRSVGAIAAAIVIGLGSLSLISTIARPLALLVFGIVIGESMSPLVNTLARVLPRAMAVVLIYFVVAALIGLVIWLSVPILIAQAGGFISQVPLLVESASEWLRQRNLPTGPALTLDNSLVGTLLSQFGSAASVLLRLPVGIASAVVEVGVVIFISLYWQLEAPGRQRFFLSLFPVDRREGAATVAGHMGQAMGGYVRGVVIQASLIGVLTFLGMLIIGVPYPLMLGALAGTLEVVPTLGPVLAAVPMALSAFVQSPTKALIVIAYVIVLQQVEAQVLVPLILRGQTRMTALTIVVALLAGGVVGGFMGVLIAIPLVAALHVFIAEVAAPALRRWTGAPPSPPGPPAAPEKNDEPAAIVPPA